REIQSAAGARDIWQVIELVAARDLGGAPNTTRLRALQSSGTTILRWLAARAGGLARASTTPVLNPRERHPTRSPGASPAPSDHDLVRAVERWLAASASRLHNLPRHVDAGSTLESGGRQNAGCRPRTSRNLEGIRNGHE